MCKIVSGTRDGSSVQQLSAIGSTTAMANLTPDYVAQQWLSCLFPALFLIGRDLLFKLAASASPQPTSAANVPVSADMVVQLLQAMLAWKQYDTYSSFAHRISIAGPVRDSEPQEEQKQGDKADKAKGKPVVVEAEPVITRIVLPADSGEHTRFTLDLLRIMYAFATDKTGRLAG